MSPSTAEIMNKGMKCLMEQLGVVEAGRFVVTVIREKFDYTRWQRDYFDGKAPEEISLGPDVQFVAAISGMLDSGAGVVLQPAVHPLARGEDFSCGGRLLADRSCWQDRGGCRHRRRQSFYMKLLRVDTFGGCTMTEPIWYAPFPYSAFFIRTDAPRSRREY